MPITFVVWILVARTLRVSRGSSGGSFAKATKPMDAALHHQKSSFKKELESISHDPEKSQLAGARPIARRFPQRHRSARALLAVTQRPRRLRPDLRRAHRLEMGRGAARIAAARLDATGPCDNQR